MSELPPELADLYAAERAATAATGARAAVRAKLAATVGHAPLGAAVGGGLGAAGKVLAVLALTVGLGAATVAALHHGSAQVSTTPATSATHEVVARTAVPAASPASLPTIAVATEPLAARPVHLLRVAHAATPEPATVPAAAAQASQPEAKVAPSQVAVIRDAWLALSARNPAHALELVQGDERVHPDGPLAEERSALTIAALAALGRLDEARAAAATFDATYPSSVHHDLIAHALTPEASR